MSSYLHFRKVLILGAVVSFFMLHFPSSVLSLSGHRTWPVRQYFRRCWPPPVCGLVSCWRAETSVSPALLPTRFSFFSLESLPSSSLASAAKDLGAWGDNSTTDFALSPAANSGFPQRPSISWVPVTYQALFQMRRPRSQRPEVSALMKLGSALKDSTKHTIFIV